jgi:hypothetical protein
MRTNRIQRRNRSSRNRRSSRRSGRRSNRSFYVETFPFSVTLGTSSSLTRVLLTGLPPRCNWRPLIITASVTQAYIPDSSTRSGTHVPSGLQIIYAERTALVSTSGLQVLGPNPRNIYCRIPVSADWLSYSLDDTYQWGILEAVCLGNPGETAFIRGVLKIRIALQPEIISPSCPTIVTLPTLPAHPDRQDPIHNEYARIFASGVSITANPLFKGSTPTKRRASTGSLSSIEMI